MDLRIVTTDRRQFTLFYLFHFSFFFFVFYLHVCVFGSHFRSHDDSHVTEEHMVELEYSLCSKNCFFPYSRLFSSSSR